MEANKIATDSHHNSWGTYEMRMISRTVFRMIHGSAQKMSNLKESYENKLIKQIILVQHNLESNDNYILKHWQVLVKD